MPRILEMNEIDGALWVRVDVDTTFPGTVSLYTDAEMLELRRSERNAALEEAAETSLALRKFKE